MSARRTPAGALQASALQPCTHTAAMAHGIAMELASLVELVEELIGAGSDDANTLQLMRHSLARLGWQADTIAHAHGGKTWANPRGALGLAGVWLLESEELCTAYVAITAAGTCTAAAGENGGAA